jgi:hypothetical protein
MTPNVDAELREQPFWQADPAMPKTAPTTRIVTELLRRRTWAEALYGVAHTTAKQAIVELRDLARGIHPPVPPVRKNFGSLGSERNSTDAARARRATPSSRPRAHR